MHTFLLLLSSYFINFLSLRDSSYRFVSVYFFYSIYILSLRDSSSATKMPKCSAPDCKKKAKKWCSNCEVTTSALEEPNLLRAKKKGPVISMARGILLWLASVSPPRIILMVLITILLGVCIMGRLALFRTLCPLTCLVKLCHGL